MENVGADQSQADQAPMAPMGPCPKSCAIPPIVAAIPTPTLNRANVGTRRLRRFRRGEGLQAVGDARFPWDRTSSYT